MFFIIPATHIPTNSTWGLFSTSSSTFVVSCLFDNSYSDRYGIEISLWFWFAFPWWLVWSRKWQPTPVFLLGVSCGQRSLEGYSPWRPKELDTTEQLSIYAWWLVMVNIFACSYWPSLEKEMATHSSTLAWKIPWMGEPGRLQSLGLQRVEHDWVTSLSFFLLFLLEEEMATNSNVLAWESHGQRGLVGCSLWGCKELDTTKQLTHTHTNMLTICLSLGKGLFRLSVPFLIRLFLSLILSCMSSLCILNISLL